jgi:outer membrane lipoprotein SlyB
MSFKKIVLGFQETLLVMSLLGCGGGNGDFVAYIRGNISGLMDGKVVVLQNNSDREVETITLTQNGSFNFGRKLIIFEDYNVTVKNQPSGQVCIVTNGSGSIKSSSEDITNILVSCR